MSIIIMILLLSFLILVHELGHFAAAKAFGIKVERFGFGLPLGPTLFEKKIGDTTFYIHALLLGGYVAFPDDDEECDLPADSSERFENKPVRQRIVVVSAGVIANVISAFFLVLFSSLVWHHLPSGNYDISVNNIIAPKDASIWASGMKKGDKIVSVNGTKINNTYSLLNIIQLSKANDGLVDEEIVDKNFERLKALNPAFTKDEIIPDGVTVRLPKDKTLEEKPICLTKNQLNGIEKYSDKQIKISDEVAKLRDYIRTKEKNIYFVSNGNYSLYDVAIAISDNKHPINFVVKRENLYIKLKPVYATETGAVGIQLNTKEILKPTTTFFSAVKDSTKYLYDNTANLLLGLGQICMGKVPLKDLHGIVAITKVGGDIISNSGIFYGILLTAIISMDLAIVNFLPIPALDGGQVLFLFIEKIIGKKAGKKVLEILAKISFFFLIALMLVVVFNDIWALVTKSL